MAHVSFAQELEDNGICAESDVHYDCIVRFTHKYAAILNQVHTIILTARASDLPKDQWAKDPLTYELEEALREADKSYEPYRPRLKRVEALRYKVGELQRQSNLKHGEPATREEVMKRMRDELFGDSSSRKRGAEDDPEDSGIMGILNGILSSNRATKKTRSEGEPPSVKEE